MFTGTNIRIRLRTFLDLSGATSLKIRYKPPSGQSGEWSATLDPDDNQFMYYDTSQADLDVAGMWNFQPVAEFGANINKGRIVQTYVNNPIPKP